MIANYTGLGKRVRVRSGYYYSQYYPWDNYKVDKEGICASAVSDNGEMCIEFDDGAQDWFPAKDIKLLE